MFKYIIKSDDVKDNLLYIFDNDSRKSNIYRKYDLDNGKFLLTTISDDAKPDSELADVKYYRVVSGENFYEEFSIIDFPETGLPIKDNFKYAAIITNDGLILIFDIIYNTSYIENKELITKSITNITVYDLFLSENGNTFEENIIDGLNNHISLIENCKYTSPNVHCLDIVNGKIVPEIKYVETYTKDDTTITIKHFFVDMDLDGAGYEQDDYGWYTTETPLENFANVIFKRKSKFIVSTASFTYYSNETKLDSTEYVYNGKTYYYAYTPSISSTIITITTDYPNDPNYKKLNIIYYMGSIEERPIKFSGDLTDRVYICT